jgi:hypothetical protein
MAQNRMMPPALLEQLQGADTDVSRRVLEHAMQRLIEAEAATQIGAGPHERASTRTLYRYGYRGLDPLTRNECRLDINRQRQLRRQAVHESHEQGRDPHILTGGSFTVAR